MKYQSNRKKKLSLYLMTIGVLFSSCVLTACKKSSVSENKVLIPEDNYRTYYEVFVGSFYDSNGDGIGDLNGLIEKLDYINDNNPKTKEDLGCDGIWLMPVMPSDTYHKYDVNDYYSIDESYGTIEDFKLLAKECDERGIKLMIDFVFNHTSDTHPWFVDACNYLKNLGEGEEPSANENKYFGYYHFEKNMDNKEHYYKVEGTDWYYEGVFWSGMPDLNLDNSEVKKEIEEIADYWINLGVGGFRLDAAKEYYSGGITKNIEVLRWFNDYVKGIDESIYVVAEVWDTFGTIAQYYESGVDSIFNYAYGNSDGKIARTVNAAGSGLAGASLAKAMQQVHDTFSARNENYIDASFVSNHDNDRCAGYVSYDPGKVKLLGGINLMMSGSSFIYYGEEIGMSGSGIDENKRAPMYWSATNSNGRTDGPINMTMQEHQFAAVDEQLKDKNSILSYYRKAIALRNTIPEIARGSITAIELDDKSIAAVKKTYQDSTIYIVYNISDTKRTVTLDRSVFTIRAMEGFLTTESMEKPELQDNVLSLPPYSIVILK